MGKHLEHEQGQGLVEYALILVLVSIVVIAILLLLGPVVGNVFSNVTTTLRTAAAGGSATSLTVTSITIDNYTFQDIGLGGRANINIHWSASCQNGLGEPVGCSVSVTCSLAGGTPPTSSSCFFSSGQQGSATSVGVTGATSSGLTWDGSAPSASGTMP